MILSGIKPNGLILMAEKMSKWLDINYFTRRYLGVLQYESYEMEELYEEFVHYKTLNESELPTNATLLDVIVKEHEDSSVECRIDII